MTDRSPLLDAHDTVRATPYHSHDTTDEVRERLDWMAEHPGEWIRWSANLNPVSARHVRPPSFERAVVMRDALRHGYGPHAGAPCGLYVRYVGYSPKSVARATPGGV